MAVYTNLTTTEFKLNEKEMNLLLKKEFSNNKYFNEEMLDALACFIVNYADLKSINDINSAISEGDLIIFNGEASFENIVNTLSDGFLMLIQIYGVYIAYNPLEICV